MTMTDDAFAGRTDSVLQGGTTVRDLVDRDPCTAGCRRSA